MRTRNQSQGSASRKGEAPSRLKQRRDFLRAGKGRRWHGKAFSLQVVEAVDGGAAARVGFTLTKKVGCAVIRNRVRRRLREAVRLDPASFRSAHDYVIVGRQEALRVPFASLLSDLRTAVDGAHRRGAARPQERGSGRRSNAVEPGRIRPEP